jgi:thiamine-phosphate pyrophosphorylase
MDKNLLKLNLITDRTGMDHKEFFRRVDEALGAGVTLLQMREKSGQGREMYELGKALRALCDRHGVPLIVDDRLDIALAIGADGVHLGQSDLPVAAARKIAGPDFIIGATAKTVEQARIALESGADYIGTGAIYPTSLKVATVLTPVSMLRKILREVEIPMLAIGGLTAGNIHVLKDVEIDGIAVVSAVMQRPDPATAVKELLDSMAQLGKHGVL